MTSWLTWRRGLLDHIGYSEIVPMIIKQLETKEEIEGKAAVHCQAWKEAYVGLMDQDFLDRRTMEMSLQSAQRAFDNGIATLIAKVGNRVIGFADYGNYWGDDLQETGEVYAIYVLKKYYGKGIGFALMKKALEALSEYPQTAVWVLAGNERAIRFYERCGFEFDGQKKELELGTPVTEVRMIFHNSERMGSV